MSNHEWERGTFKLPSGEFAGFRQAMQDVDAKEKQQIFDLSQEFWKSLSRKQQGDSEECFGAVQDFIDAKAQETTPSYNGGWGSQSRATYDEATINGLNDLLQRKAGGRRWSGPGGAAPSKPTRVLKSDVDFPTNRSLVFRSGESAVVFDKAAKTVSWSTGHNNHAVEHAHDSRLGGAFFAQMAKVRWTHGTGGSLAYNSENNESYEVGRGANLCTGAYGYVGIAENPSNAIPFVNAKGQRIGAESKRDRYGQIVGKAVPVDASGRPIKKSPAPRKASAAPAAPGRAKTTAASTAGSFAARHRDEVEVQL